MKRSRGPKHRFLMKRVEAKLMLESATKPIKARLFLGELKRSSALLFTEEKAAIGSHVSFFMESGDNPLYLKGRVTACSHANMHPKVIKENPLDYRMELSFVFDDPRAERDFSDYCARLQKLRR